MLSVTTRVLERNGYGVASAPGGKEALSRVEEISDRGNLITTDMMVPAMEARPSRGYCSKGDPP